MWLSDSIHCNPLQAALAFPTKPLILNVTIINGTKSSHEKYQLKPLITLRGCNA